jgi:hypothetical protein
VRRRKRASLSEVPFGAQRAFIDDPSRLKAALCTRRSGKSYACGVYMLGEALRHPGATVLYVALTRESAKRIMLKDILRVLDRGHAIGARFNEVELSVTLPNGSVIYLLGVDASDAERDKLLGQKYRLAVVDESASYRISLRDLVYATLRPATADYRGTIALIGTPGNVRSGLFFDVTTGTEPGWSVHRWSARDNPHLDWDSEIADFVAGNPAVRDTPRFKQMFLGQWVVDTSALIFAGYDPTRNDVVAESLPADLDNYVFVLGVDLGFSDATALTLVAYARHDPTLWVLRSQKRAGLDVSETAAWIRRWADQVPIAATVADTSSRQVVEELRRRHAIPIEAAEKAGKGEAMIMMSSDLLTGRVRVLQPQCSQLTDEWAGAVWDEAARERGRLIEHPGCTVDCIDSALYAWRRATNYAARPLGPPRWLGPPRDDEESEAYADRLAEGDGGDEGGGWAA